MGSLTFFHMTGDGAAIAKALEMAGSLFSGAVSRPETVELGQDTSELFDNIEQLKMPGKAAVPAASLPAVRDEFACKTCGETFSARGKLSAHSRLLHPKKGASATSGDQAGDLGPAAAKMWCPIKNCGRYFSKKAWLNQHLERAHGITEGL